MLKVAIVVIGDEILLGRVTDTNSGFISRALDTMGARTISVCTVGDDASAIRGAIEEALSKADVVFTTGGLGPTKDDITKGVMYEIFGGEPIRDAAITRNIEDIFGRRGRTLNELTLDQAVVPSTAEIVQNLYGTAPIMIFEKGGKYLVTLPGVPFETEGMLTAVLDVLRTKVTLTPSIKHSTVVVTGLSESGLAQQLAGFEEQLPPQFKLAYLPDSPIIRLRLDCYDVEADFDKYANLLDTTLQAIDGLTIIGCGEKTIAGFVVDILKKRGQTLSTAESCTGGNVAHLLTEVSGASAVYMGGIVSYDNAVKTGVLGVDPGAIARHGAVSEEVVRQMAEGARRVTATDFAISTSGVAGPTGGTPDKPVGTVWMAVSTPEGTVADCMLFAGDRHRVIQSASNNVLIKLIKQLLKNK